MYSVRSSSYRSRNHRGARRPGVGERSFDSRRRITLAEGLIIAVCAAAVAVTFTRALVEPSPASLDTVPVRVQSSETLWDLATAHPVEGLTTAQTVDYIQDLNDRTDPSLAVGEVVLVPAAPGNATALAAR